MFKYVYEVAPIDFMDGTISIENYIDSIISDLSLYKDDLLHDNNADDDAEDNIGINPCLSPLEEELVTLLVEKSNLIERNYTE